VDYEFAAIRKIHTFAYVVYLFIMLTSDDILAFIKENKSFLKEKFYCVEIGLFGSFARNEQNENSDIDLLVVFEQDVPNLFEVERELKRFMSNQFNRQVDICTKKWIRPVFKPLVLNETIYA
jgi:hypothetical protein